MAEKKTRILHVMYGGYRGGIETVVFNYYRYIDKKKYDFDFVVHGKKKFEYQDAIESMGGRVIYAPTLGSGMKGYIRSLRRIIAENGGYDAIHIHTGQQAGFVGLAGLMSGIKVRICHVHNTGLENSFYQKLFFLWRWLIYLFCNRYIACTEEAGRIWFKWRKFDTLPNAIDFSQYREVDEERVRGFLDGLSVPRDALVLGHAGRFVQVKNHEFLVELIKRLKERGRSDVCLLLAGEGPLMERISAKVRDCGLEDSVRFLGSFEDMPLFWNSVDIMLLPSHSEGFPLVFAEAQAAGAYSLLSSGVRSAADSDFTNYSVLRTEDLDAWADEIEGYDRSRPRIRSKGSVYDLALSVTVLEGLYDRFILDIVN